MNKRGALMSAYGLCLSSLCLGGYPTVWVKVLPAMDHWVYSSIDDLNELDRECKSDNVMPRVCIYRHLSRCRIIFIGRRAAIPTPVHSQLIRMCQGWFPEPILLQREWSNENYLPNQGAPLADPSWHYQNDPATIK